MRRGPGAWSPSPPTRAASCAPRSCRWRAPTPTGSASRPRTSCAALPTRCTSTSAPTPGSTSPCGSRGRGRRAAPSAASARPRSSPGCRSTGTRTCSARASRARRGWGRRPSTSPGATAYAEKNWGPAFTEHWWWGQAQGFPGADACVAFAGGRIALAGVRAAPTAVVVRVEDRVLRLAPPLARMTAAVGEAGWRIRGRSARHTRRDRGRGGGRARGPAGARAGPAGGRGPLAPPPGRAAARRGAAGAADGVRGRSRGWRGSSGGL